MSGEERAVGTYDLVVIGTGSGLEVSAAAAQEGWRVAVVEDGPFGGTCLNRGCIPSKLLVHVADVARTITDAHRFGIHARIDEVDWPFIVERTFAEIDRDAASIRQGNDAADTITVIDGTARFTGPRRLAVDGVELTAETIVVAAGTRPSMPPIPGLSEVGAETTDTIMRMPQLPRRLAILGGGFVAAEMAHLFGSLGVEVTIITRGPTMVRDEDRDVAARLTEAYGRRFRLLLAQQARRVSRSADGIRIELPGDVVDCDVLLVATGRVPNTDRLNVAAAGIETDERGFVRTDEYLRTTADGIWALGDIVGRYQLKHNANLEAAHVANNLLNPDELAKVDYHAMPAAIFGSPQVGSVGMTEQAAEASGRPYVVARRDYVDTAYGQSIEEHDGFVKVLADPTSGEVLGCHVIGHDASTLVQEAVNVMRFRLPLDAIAQSIYIHPALPEVIQAAFAAASRAVAEAGHAAEHEHHHEGHDDTAGAVE